MGDLCRLARVDRPGGRTLLAVVTPCGQVVGRAEIVPWGEGSWSIASTVGELRSLEVRRGNKEDLVSSIVQAIILDFSLSKRQSSANFDLAI